MKPRVVKPRGQRLVRRSGLLVVALAAAALPERMPPGRAATAPTPAYTKGFDACAAPSLTTMSKWKTSSPYVNVGVYIGGANRGCAQPNLTASWVSSVWAQGWKLLPIWVGPQASCTHTRQHHEVVGGHDHRVLPGPRRGAGRGAPLRRTLGLGWMTPIYYDMEGYARGGACSASVQFFVNGWVRQLNALGLPRRHVQQPVLRDPRRRGVGE